MCKDDPYFSLLEIPSSKRVRGVSKRDQYDLVNLSVAILSVFSIGMALLGTQKPDEPYFNTLPPNSLFKILVEDELLELRERCRKIFSILSCPIKYSARKISKLTEIPKSSVHRHAKAIEKRNLYPESFFLGNL